MVSASSQSPCEFDLDSAKCLGCCCFSDCLDAEIPLTIPTPEPRTDAPIKVIVPWCHTCRGRNP